jgi:hypothetical protein
MESSTERTVNALESLARSFDRIALTVEKFYSLAEKVYEKHYPQPKAIRDAVVHRKPTEEERIREEQGATGEALYEWLTGLGRREKEITETGSTKNAEAAEEESRRRAEKARSDKGTTGDTADHNPDAQAGRGRTSGDT